MEILPLAEVKDHFSEYVERVAGERDRFTITRNGRSSAVLINPEDLESLEETLAILGDRKEVKAIHDGLLEIESGQTTTLEEIKRGLL